MESGAFLTTLNSRFDLSSWEEEAVASGSRILTGEEQGVILMDSLHDTLLPGGHCNPRFKWTTSPGWCGSMD